MEIIVDYRTKGWSKPVDCTCFSFAGRPLQRLVGGFLARRRHANGWFARNTSELPSLKLAGTIYFPFPTGWSLDRARCCNGSLSECVRVKSRKVGIIFMEAYPVAYWKGNDKELNEPSNPPIVTS
jgi:hypothetical protein